MSDELLHPFSQPTRGGRFENLDLDGAELLFCRLEDARIKQSRLGGVTLSGVQARNASFEHVDLRRSRFTSVDLRGVVIEDAQIEGLIINGRPIGEILQWMEEQ